MKLSLGICGLCAANDKVVVAFGSKKIISFLPQTLKNFIGIRKFDEISSTLKLCPYCAAHMLQVAQYEEKLGLFSALNHRCSICRSVEHLVNIKEWLRFDGLLENINAERTSKCAVCLPCIAYLERLDVIKGYFLKQFPNLQKTTNPKRKIKEQTNVKKMCSSPSESDSEDKLHNGINTDLNSKKERNCKRYNPGKNLNHLKPLKYSGLKIEQYKSDSKLLEQVAFVKLKTSKRMATVAEKSQKKSSSSCTNRDLISSVSSPCFKIKLIAKKHKKKNASKEQVTSKRRVKKSKLIEQHNQQTSKTKKLIVRVLKTNLDELKKQFEHITLEAVNKARPESSTDIARDKTVLDSKKKKNVSFAEDITICDKTARTSPMDLLKTDLLDLILSKKTDEKLTNRTTDEDNLGAAFKRKRLFLDDMDSEANPENDHSHSVNEKRRKPDAFDELKYGSSSEKEDVTSTDNENISVFEHSLATNEKENGDSLDLRTELIVSDETDNENNDNALSCNGNNAKFTTEDQLNDDKSKEDNATVDELSVNLSESKSDTSSEDTVVTLAEYKQMKSADGSALCNDTEDSSDGCHTGDIKSKEDIIDSSRCEEEVGLTDQNEESVTAKMLINSQETDNTSGAVEATQNVVMDDYEDDYSPESLHLHLDFE